MHNTPCTNCDNKGRVWKDGKASDGVTTYPDGHPDTPQLITCPECKGEGWFPTDTPPQKEEPMATCCPDQPLHKLHSFTIVEHVAFGSDGLSSSVEKKEIYLYQCPDCHRVQIKEIRRP